MADILVRAGCFVGIILLGYGLRRVGYFQEEDFHVLSKIVIKITLTAAIVTNFSGHDFSADMLLLTLMGLGFGVLLVFLAWLVNAKQGPAQQAFAMVNTAGCNIGNFALPFAQGFLGPVGVMATSLFDSGNSMICLGGSYSVANMVCQGQKRFSVKPILKALSRSTPFITYVLMTLLSALHIALPGPVLEFAGIIANANAFLAMFMLGVGFRLRGDKTQRGAIARVLVLRYGVGLALALLSYFWLPFPLEYRQALVVLFLSPIASAAPAFTAELKSDFGLASAINSISIVVSIVLITTALVIML